MCDLLATSDLAARLEALRAEERRDGVPADPFVETYLMAQREQAGRRPRRRLRDLLPSLGAGLARRKGRPAPLSG